MARTIASTPQIDELIRTGAPVAIGVSGGKDSDAAAFITSEELDRRGHAGPRVLIHSDLGRVEWRESLPQCERLAARLGLELIVVRRQSGEMMDRWLTRWANNVARYINLDCVKVILPWSTAAMRFCTSELKTAIICRELVKRFPNSTILSVAGIRREESPNRAKAKPLKQQNKLTSATHNTMGFDWLPILDWTRDEVIALHYERDFPLHEAYATNSRVSCMYCILASRDDLRATTTWDQSHDLYREMVGLEIVSTFAFQDSGWLGDVAPHLLSSDMAVKLADAKRRAAERQQLEAEIPAYLLYAKEGWPLFLPNQAEAQLLARVRREVGALLNIPVRYTDADAVRARYLDLMSEAGRAPREYSGPAVEVQQSFI
jgi:3'-phosphoadenosine 5'-phosphosulfate sulfotransferase (PAPS reductase)/FAD synthetase